VWWYKSVIISPASAILFFLTDTHGKKYIKKLLIIRNSLKEIYGSGINIEPTENMKHKPKFLSQGSCLACTLWYISTK
jgi:hypothetical protein